MNEVLKVEGVTKVYGKQVVLDNVSLSLERGEIMGLVGPNGAGKTTLMKVITKLIKNYEGNVYIGDENIRINREHDKKQIGCVIETPGFYPNLTGYENLEFFSLISGVKDKNEIHEIASKLGIEGYINKKAKTYSLGMRQRLGIAQAVLSYPEILILDEPTNGLDPEIVPQLREFIKYVAKEKNISVLISSHILSEIELMCDRVTFIQKGKIIKVENLNAMERDTAITALVTSKLSELKKYLKENKIAYRIICEDTVHVTLKNEDIEKFTTNIIKNNIPLRGVYEVKENLEARYLKTMEGEQYA